jgi:hypothetical protein
MRAGAVFRASGSPKFKRMPVRPSNTLMQIAIGCFFMPALVWAAWSKAWQFDPYTMSFFTKTYVAPTPDMPGELRIAGWVLIVIALLPGYAGFKGMMKRIGKIWENLLLLWFGCLIAAFGGAFFIAADAAQVRISREQQKVTFVIPAMAATVQGQ